MSTVMDALRGSPAVAGALGRTARELAPVVTHGVVTDGFRRTHAAGAPPVLPRTRFDPREHTTLVDPYSWLPQMHEHPVWVNEQLDAWILTGYDDLRQAGLDNGRLSSAEGIFLNTTTTKSVITRDRPDHTRLRGVTAKLFTRDALARLEPDIVGLADQGIDRLARGETADAVDALCAPVPMTAIAVLLGIPAHRWREFKQWAEPWAKLFAPGSPTSQMWLLARVLPDAARFRLLIEEEVARRGGGEHGDLLGVLRLALDAGEIDDTEVFLYALIMLVAGQETTGNLLGSTIAALSTRPELYARLRADRTLLPAAIEEFVRWSSPVQWVSRWTRERYEVGGCVIPRNARVLLPWMFGNRDPRRFPEPDVIDIDRDAKAHLGFGSGIHFCLGSHLARLEARVVLDRFLERVERLEPAGPVRYATTVSLHGPAEVPVRVTPAR